MDDVVVHGMYENSRVENDISILFLHCEAKNGTGQIQNINGILNFCTLLFSFARAGISQKNVLFFLTYFCTYTLIWSNVHVAFK